MSTSHDALLLTMLLVVPFWLSFVMLQGWRLVRVRTSDGTELADGKFGARFVAAKSRVAPLKELTIPRLELQAAVIASRLGKTITEQSRFNFERVRYLSDSRVVLACIKGETHSYKPFVSCRVGEIQSNSQPSDWLHCPTDLSVADDLTKGISAGETHGRWFDGPPFLQLPEEQWPTEQGAPDTTEVKKETRKVHIVKATMVPQPIFKCENMSSWKRFLRVTAYVFRFIHNVRAKLGRSTDKKDVGPLEAKETEISEEYWIKVASERMLRVYGKNHEICIKESHWRRRTYSI